MKTTIQIALVVAATAFALNAMSQDYLNPSTDAKDSPFANQCYRVKTQGRAQAFFFSEFGEVFLDHAKKKNGKIKKTWDEADMTWRYNEESGNMNVRGAYYSTFVAMMAGNGWVRVNWRGTADGGGRVLSLGRTTLVKCECYRY